MVILLILKNIVSQYLRLKTKALSSFLLVSRVLICFCIIYHLKIVVEWVTVTNISVVMLLVFFVSNAWKCPVLPQSINSHYLLCDIESIYI